MNLQTLRRRAADNSLEVEHILQAAKRRVPGLSAELAALARDHNWSMVTHLEDGTHVVPLARWAQVASAYTDRGVTGLRDLAHDPQCATHVVCLLEELNSKEAIDGLLTLFAEVVDEPAKNPPLAHRLASAINGLFSFKSSPASTPAQRGAAARFLNKALAVATSNSERAVVMCAMRGAGDAASLNALLSSGELDPPYREVRAAAIKAIRKRQRDEA